MPLTPCFDPSTGASGGTAPSPVTPATGAPLQVIDTDMSGADQDFSTTVGDVVIDGVTWHTVNDDPSLAIAEAAGTRVVSDSSGYAYYLITQIPDVSAGDYICVSLKWEPIVMGDNGQTFQLRLAQAKTTDTVYDLVMTLKRLASNWRCRHGYYTSYTMAYIGDAPWSATLPGACVMMLTGSGYSWQTSCTTATAKPAFRSLPVSANAGGSLRARGAGQTQGDTLPHYQWLKVLVGPDSADIEVRITDVQVWVGAKVVS